jgi:hypothetical protein
LGNPNSMIGLCQEGKGSPDALHSPAFSWKELTNGVYGLLRKFPEDIAVRFGSVTTFRRVLRNVGFLLSAKA